jgi:hypothetical protein
MKYSLLILMPPGTNKKNLLDVMKEQYNSGRRVDREV